MGKREKSVTVVCREYLGPEYQYRAAAPLDYLDKALGGSMFDDELGVFLRSIVAVHRHWSGEMSEEKSVVLYRLCHMVEVLIGCYEMKQNGLYPFIQQEFRQELLLGFKDYLPESQELTGYRAFFNYYGLDNGLKAYESIHGVIENMTLKAHEGWGLRLLTETYLWYGVCTPVIREVAAKMLRRFSWTEKDYVLSNTPLNSIRKMVKSCHLAHDDYDVIEYNEVIRLIVWFNSVMGSMGERVQAGLLS